MNFLKREKMKIAANTGLLTDSGMSKAAFKQVWFSIISHTWTVNHFVSYLSVLHQVFSTLEAFVELRNPPWCNDLRKKKKDRVRERLRVDPATQFNQHKKNGAAKLP